MSDFGIEDSSYNDTEFTVKTEDSVLGRTTHLFALQSDGILSYGGDIYTIIED